MFTEIKRFFAFLLGKEGGKLRERILLIFIGIIILFFINRFILFQISDNRDFLFSSAISNLMIESGVNPYRSDIAEVITSIYPEEISDSIETGFIFKKPIFVLFLYYPFSLMKDPVWSTAVWMVVTQALMVASVFIFFNMIQYRSSFISKMIVSAISLLFFFTINTQINLNLSAIQMMSLLLVFKFSHGNQYIKSGIFLALLFIQPLTVIPVIAVLILIFIATRETNQVVWMVISLILMCMAGMIYQTDWILKYLQNLIFESPEFPFIGFGDAYFNAWSGLNLGRFFNYLPIIAAIWIALEWIRIPKQTLNQQLWMVSLAIVLNPYLFIDAGNKAGIFYLFVILFLFYLWETRSGRIFNIILYGFTLLITIILPIINWITIFNVGVGASPNIINMIYSSFLVILLYWVKWWVVREYPEDTILIS